MLTRAIKRIAYAMFAFAIIATPAYAATYTYHIDTSKDPITPGYANMGYWSPTLAVADHFQTYMVGKPGQNSDGSNKVDNVRNYFTFSLASIDFSKEQLVSASLQIRAYGYNVNKNDANETVEFFDVTTPYGILNTQQGISNGPGSIFNDLGTGTKYGDIKIWNTIQGQDVLHIPLNAAARADITAAAGGYFSVGGICTSCDAEEVLFANSGPNGLQQLTLETRSIAQPVPEPAEWTMLVAGLLVIGFIARRRRAASLSA
jgi:hypothetical protein